MDDYKHSTAGRFARFSPRRRMAAGIFAGLLLFLPIWHFEFLSVMQPPLQASVDKLTSLSDSPQLHKNIAVASSFGYHFDVYLAVAWTLKRVMQEGSIQLYTPWPYYFDFQKIVDGYGLYSGTIKSYKDLTRDIMDNGGVGGIDLVILGTCEIDMRHWNDELLKAWDARGTQHKFQIVCIVHNALDDIWQDSIPEWSRRNAIRLLPISEHVARTFRMKFQDQARGADPALRSAGLEYVPVDSHVPILDIRNLPDLSPKRVLSNAVIQGSFDNSRRDYTRILSELNASLHETPEAWGYLPLGDNPSFIANKRREYPEFKLHLVGSGWLNVPTELKSLVIFHTNLNYTKFYEIMSGMDVCIPAFLSEDDMNFRYQASSSIAMCMEANVPILALQQLRDAYTHIDDDQITITRPAAMSEIEALKALRTGDASGFLANNESPSGAAPVSLLSHSRVRHAVAKMMEGGWIRSKGNFEFCKKATWRKNEVVISSILQDLW